MNTSTVILKNCESFVLKDEHKKGAFYGHTRAVCICKYKLMTVVKRGQYSKLAQFPAWRGEEVGTRGTPF